MRNYIPLILIFLLAFAVRLPFVQYEPTVDSFELLRNAESVVQTGMPLFEDALSYGGRETITNVAVPYVLALIGGLSSDPFLIKLVLALIGAAIVLPVYSLLGVKAVKESHRIALTVFSAIMPLFVMRTTYDISIDAIVMLLHLLFIWIFFMKKSSKRTVLAIFIPILASFVSPSFAIMILGLLIYITIQSIENRKIERFVIEQTVYSVSIFILITYVVFKQGIANHGLLLFKQLVNVSSQSMIHLNLLFILMTIYLAYRCFFHTHRRSTLLLTSFIVSAVLLGLTNLTTVTSMVLHVNFFMVILSGLFLDRIKSYFLATNFSKYTDLIVYGAITILLITWVLPFATLSEPEANSDLISHLSTLPADSTIFAPPHLAHKIMFYTNLKTYGEEDIILVSKGEMYREMRSSISQDISQASVLKKLAEVTTIRPLYIVTKEVPPYASEPCFPYERINGNTITEVTCQQKS